MKNWNKKSWMKWPTNSGCHTISILDWRWRKMHNWNLPGRNSQRLSSLIHTLSSQIKPGTSWKKSSEERCSPLPKWTSSRLQPVQSALLTLIHIYFIPHQGIGYNTNSQHTNLIYWEIKILKRLLTIKEKLVPWKIDQLPPHCRWWSILNNFRKKF